MHPTVHTSIFKCIKVHVHTAFVYHSPHYYGNRCRYVKFGASIVLCVVCTNAPEKKRFIAPCTREPLFS